MKIEEKKRIKEKLEFFYAEKCKIHISKIDKIFWNGFIIGKKSEDVFILQEDKLGKCYLFVKDVYNVDLCREVKI